MLPEQAQGPNIALPSPADKLCFMYLVDNCSGSAVQPAANQPGGSSSLEAPSRQHDLNGVTSAGHCGVSLLVFCQVQLQPERATAWMAGLLELVQAQHVLVITSLPVSSLF